MSHGYRWLKKIAPPALPRPPQEMRRSYFEQLNNVLRLFFTSFSASLNHLIGRAGGRFIDSPRAMFYSDQDQILSAINTAHKISFNNTKFASAITREGTPASEITVEFPGIYQVDFSAQARSNSASAKTLHTWVRFNGTDVPFSCKEFAITDNGTVTQLAESFEVELEASGYIEAMWSADDTDIVLDAQAATAVHPAMASATVGIFLLSAYTEGT